MNDQTSYVRSAIARIRVGDAGDGYALKIQTRHEFGQQETKWLNLTRRQLDAIEAVLAGDANTVGSDPEDGHSVTIDGFEVMVGRSLLEHDTGKPVVTIDGEGPIRVNMNDGTIWDANPGRHVHAFCQCAHGRDTER